MAAWTQWYAFFVDAVATITGELIGVDEQDMEGALALYHSNQSPALAAETYVLEKEYAGVDEDVVDMNHGQLLINVAG